MNREERRAAQKRGIDHHFIKRLQDETKKNTINDTTNFVVASALLVLRDQFGWGEGRAKRFMEHFTEVFDDVQSGRIEFNDVMKTIEQELRIKFESR